MSHAVTLRIEMDRGRGWELRSEGLIPADTDAARIEQDLRHYAVGYPHRALVEGIEVARVGAITGTYHA